MATIASLTEKIRGYDQRIEALAEECYPESELLRPAKLARGGSVDSPDLRADS